MNIQLELVIRVNNSQKCIVNVNDLCIDQTHWSEDMTKYPELQFGDVYTYLINTEDQFTKKN